MMIIIENQGWMRLTAHDTLICIQINCKLLNDRVGISYIYYKESKYLLLATDSSQNQEVSLQFFNLLMPEAPEMSGLL